jgi:TPP-dependent pyruvate/acetoin dehydrogenase alpha subunit
MQDNGRFTPEQGANAFRQMVLIRTVESLFLEYYAKGIIKGTVHTCLGQEACAVGLMNGLCKDKDVVFSAHRAHGHYLAYGGPIEGLVAEVMGKTSGICGGVGGTQHLHYRNLYTNGVQGGMVPSAVGAALAEKLKGSGAISVALLGDGTMGQGTVYECFNLSALWCLPLLFVLENNQFAQSTPTRMAQVGRLCDRAAGFGIGTAVCDGNDVEAVAHAAAEAAARVRSGLAPFFLELTTYRLGPHSKGDDPRTKEEIAPHWECDPLRVARQRVGGEQAQAVEREVRRDTEELFERVMRK